MLDLSVLAQRGDGPLGVAVSGGGDSVALLLMLRDWAQDVEIVVATVDHDLRVESAAEAAWVAQLCDRLGLAHTTLRWVRGADETGNLSERGRDARRQLLAEWITRVGGSTVVLGHTQDDVAETFLMRLSRGSGVDGLSMMRAVSRREDVRWLRPLLDVGRDALRDYLRARNQGWHDDPTNEDEHYARVRTRKALQVLQGLDIDPVRIAQTAQRLSLSRDVLAQQTVALAQNCVHQTRYGELMLSRLVFTAAPVILQERLIRQILAHFTGPTHAPRQDAIARMRSAVGGAQAATLNGVQMRSTDAGSCFSREYTAVSPAMAIQGPVTHWDHGWRIAVPDRGWQIAALGEDGLRQCPPRPKGLRAVVARCLPGVWQGDRLVAAAVLKPHDQVIFRQSPFVSGGAPH